MIPQGEDFLREDSHLYTGKADGAPTLDSSKPETVAAQYHDTFPASITVDEAFVKRGQERYNIYCAVCHGQTGNADGTIVQRGFLRPPAFTRPPSNRGAMANLMALRRNTTLGDWAI